MNNLFSLFSLTLMVFLSLFAAKSFAVGYPLPVGHEEALMGNAGAALEDSPGNVIYNPAGLGFRSSKDLNLTVSGNALGQQRFSTGLDDETSDVTIRPLLAAGVYPAGDGTPASSSPIPSRFEFYKEVVKRYLMRRQERR